MIRLLSFAMSMCLAMIFVPYSIAASPESFDDLPGPFWKGGAEIELRMVDSEGRPVAGAKVDVGTSYDSAYLKFGRPPHPTREPDTDTLGVYPLVLPERFTTVVVSHDAGVAVIDPLALIDHQGPMVVRLQPWSSVAGRLVDAQGQPIAGEVIRLDVGHWVANQLNPSLDVYYEATTDEEGAFSFDRVPPGLVRVFPYALSKHEPGQPASIFYGRSAFGRAEPGQELVLQVGGGGRAVRGQLLDADATEESADLSASRVSVVQRVEAGDDWTTTPLPKPIDHSIWPVEKRRAWRDAWNSSAQRLAHEKRRAGLIFVQRSHMQHGRVQADGTFEVLDVPAGGYNLKATLPDDTRATYPIDLITKEQESTDPGLTPLDLGVLPIASVRVEVGDIMPDFEMTELPLGDPAVVRSFGEFKGRYVLLDVWATWCGPCLAQTPNIQAVVDTFADDDRLVVLTVSGDKTPDRPTHYLQAKSLGGIHAWFSELQDKDRASRIQFRGYPSIWLIGPDGTILAQDLFDEDIMAAVTQALAGDQGN